MSHVINPNALRLGSFSLTWNYVHKFSEISRVMKLHLELNYLLNYFLKIYGFGLLKYHISFETGGLKLNVVVLRYVFSITNQKIFNYYREDVRTINNPFSAVTQTDKFTGTNTDMRFLHVGKNLEKLRTLGLSRDTRRWDETSYAWYSKIDSISEQKWSHPSLKFLRFYTVRGSIKHVIKKKLANLLYGRRALTALTLLALFKIRRFVREKWFDIYENFTRTLVNKYYFPGFNKDFFVKGRAKFYKCKLSGVLIKKVKMNSKKLFFRRLNSSFFKKKKLVPSMNISLIKSYVKKSIKTNIKLDFLNLNYSSIKSFFYNSVLTFRLNLLVFFNFFPFLKIKKKLKNNSRIITKNSFNFIHKKFNRLNTNKHLIPKNVRNSFFPKFFFSNKKRYILSYFHSFLRDKLVLLSLSHMLLDKFNLVFFINIYNGVYIFKDSSLKNDLVSNLSLVRRWAPAKMLRVFTYFYIVLLVCIRLRIAGPISSIIAMLLGKTMIHHKILFCFRNIIANLMLTSNKLKNWKGLVIDAVGRVNGSDRKKYSRYASSRIFRLSTFDSIVNQSNKRSITRYGLVNIKVLSFWDFV